MSDSGSALIIPLTAEIAQFRKAMEQAAGINTKAVRDILRENARLKKQMAANFAGIASDANRVLSTIGLGISASAFIGFARDALQAADQLGELRDQSGFTTDELQSLQYAGIKAGLSFEDVNSGALKFNKTLGDFLQDQSGPGAKAFEQLGLKARIANGEFSNTSQVFRAAVEQLAQVKEPALQAALGAELFGKALGPKLVPLIQQSGGSIDKLIASAKAAGVVLGEDVVNGAGDANDAIKLLSFTLQQDGIKALSDLAPKIIDVTNAITDDVKVISDWTSGLSSFFSKLGQQYPLLAKFADKAIEIANTTFNPLAQVHGIIKSIDQSTRTPETVTVTPMQTLPGDSPLKLGAKAGEADRLKTEADARKKALDQLLQLQQRANADALSAEDRNNIQLLAGQTGYYAAVIKQIDDELQAKLDAINLEEKTQIDSLDHLKGLSKADRDARIAIIKDITDAKINAAEVERQIALDNADAPARTDTALTTGGAGKSTSRSIELADQLRNGLEGLEEAGVENFKDLSSAAAGFAKQLAAMIVKLYVIKPLLDRLLGASGTPLGGGGQSGKSGGDFFSGIASFIGNLFGPGHAGGGPVTAGKVYPVGEKGPELFAPGVSGTIIPNSRINVPRAATRSGGGQMAMAFHTSIDLTGANGDAAIEDAARRGAAAGARIAVSQIKKSFPTMMLQASDRTL